MSVPAQYIIFNICMVFFLLVYRLDIYLATYIYEPPRWVSGLGRTPHRLCRRYGRVHVNGSDFDQTLVNLK